MYFAGHHPALREETMELWIKTMRQLIPVSEAEMFAHYGKRGLGETMTRRHAG